MRNLQIIDDEDLPGQCADKGARLIGALRAALGDHPHVGDIRGKGLMCAVELVADRSTKQCFPASDEALEKDGCGPLDAEVARALKFRPHAIRKLPMVQRARRAKVLIERGSNTELAYELFGSYLMANCKSLVTDFLDAINRQYENEAQERSLQLSGKLKSLVEELANSATLSQQTLRVLMSAPGIDCVLLGMRRTPYVEDALEALKAPAVPEAKNLLVELNAEEH